MLEASERCVEFYAICRDHHWTVSYLQLISPKKKKRQDITKEGVQRRTRTTIIDEAITSDNVSSSKPSSAEIRANAHHHYKAYDANLTLSTQRIVIRGADESSTSTSGPGMTDSYFLDSRTEALGHEGVRRVVRLNKSSGP
jgi:hypothetical protein